MTSEIPKTILCALRASWIVPMTCGDSTELIEDGMVLFETRYEANKNTDVPALILYVGKYSESVLKSFDSVEFEHLPNHLLIPGLINCHTHSGMSLFRGFGDDMGLQQWLHECIFPAESHFVSREFVELGTRLAIFEMLKTGTTTFVDQYYHCEAAATIAHSVGIRIACGEPIIDLADGHFAPKIDHAFAVLNRLESTFSPDWVIPIVNPHACYTVPARGFEEIRDNMKIKKHSVHTHLHETHAECIAFSRDHFGRSAMDVLIDTGLFGPRLIAAHCVCLSAMERELIATHKVNVVHCPKSNLKLASGVCPVQALLNLGVNVALGTDGAASNNSLSMISEMQIAALIGKTVVKTSQTVHHDDSPGMSPTSKSTGFRAGDPTAVSCRTVLKMATYNGATALGMEDKIGSIEVSKFADIVAVDLSSPECLPVFDPVSALVYTTGARITHVWVGGRRVVKNSQVLNVEIDSKKIEKLVLQMKAFATHFTLTS